MDADKAEKPPLDDNELENDDQADENEVKENLLKKDAEDNIETIQKNPNAGAI